MARSDDWVTLKLAHQQKPAAAATAHETYGN